MADASSSTAAAPASYGLRRAFTVDEPGGASQFRRRADFTHMAGDGNGTTGGPTGPFRRRQSSTSNLSDYSSVSALRRRGTGMGAAGGGTGAAAAAGLVESTDYLLNPRPEGFKRDDRHETSGWAGLPLASALLPAAAGIFFDNGSAFFTDVMLLTLAGVFLYWSVTQPWKWYHAAREIRVVKEAEFDVAVEDESDFETGGAPSPDMIPESKLEDIGEDEKATPLASGEKTEGGMDDQPEEPPAHPSGRNNRRQSHQRRTTTAAVARAQAAQSELRALELTYLLCCFALPLLAAYLLHEIRGRLSRPSEGLVSNYNLAIFLLAAELRPASHLLTLVHARTLHLQRVVAGGAGDDDDGEAAQLRAVDAEVLDRLDALEAARTAADVMAAAAAAAGLDVDADPGDASAAASHQQQQEEQQLRAQQQQQQQQQQEELARQVRSSLQGDVDAIARAVRRYEKKAAVLGFQTEGRLRQLEARLEDAVALAHAAAAAAARSGRGFGARGAITGLAVAAWRGTLRLLDAVVATVVVVPLRTLAVVLALPAAVVVNTIVGAYRALVTPRGGAPRADGRSAKARGKAAVVPEQRAAVSRGGGGGAKGRDRSSGTRAGGGSAGSRPAAAPLQSIAALASSPPAPDPRDRDWDSVWAEAEMLQAMNGGGGGAGFANLAGGGAGPSSSSSSSMGQQQPPSSPQGRTAPALTSLASLRGLASNSGAVGRNSPAAAAPATGSWVQRAWLPLGGGAGAAANGLGAGAPAEASYEPRRMSVR